MKIYYLIFAIMYYNSLYSNSIISWTFQSKYTLKSSVIKNTQILTPFIVKIASNYAFLFLNKENKILLGPPKKGSGIRTFAIRLHGQ